MSKPNNGAFYISASDIESTDSFTVPNEEAGETPDGTTHETQASYSVDNRQKKHAKGYYIHIYNNWDVKIKASVYGSSYDDREMRKKVLEQDNTELEPGEAFAFEEDTGHSFIEVEISNLIAAPTSGTLEIVFQDRYR